MSIQIHQHIDISQSVLRKAVERHFDSFLFYIFQENPRTDAELLADYLDESGDFPDNELADSIEKASREFRQNFRLRPS